MSLRLTVFYTFLLLATPIFSQVERPGDNAFENSEHSKAPIFSIESPDVTYLKQEDKKERKRTTPFRYGVPMDCDITLPIDGHTTWSDSLCVSETLITSQNALSLSLIFDEFYLPPHAKLYLASLDSKEIIGAYTAANNNQNLALGTNLIHKDTLLLRCTYPVHASKKIQLHVSHVVYGYKHIDYKTQKVNESGDCNIDINCPLGDDWQDEKRSVVRILTAGYSCTGTLVNTTNESGTPYLLTANHCYDEAITSPANSVFLFNFDSPTTSCASFSSSSDPNSTDEINGSIKKANSVSTDFYLVELNNAPPVDYNAYYAGWDRSGEDPVEVTGIHHPSGDVKKICQFTNTPIKENFNAGNGSAACWKVPDWTYGVTEGGSSGSSLFSEDHKIIGQLYGGLASCIGTTDNDLEDYYGRFDVSWEGDGDATTRLKDWLDPINTGVLQTDGYDPNVPVHELDAGIINVGNLDENYCDSASVDVSVTLRNAGRSNLSSALIIYGQDDFVVDSLSWVGSLDSTESTLVILSQIEILEGSHNFWAAVKNPNNSLDENANNDSVSIPYTRSYGGAYSLNLSFDCFPEETSWQLIDENNFLLYNGSNYGIAESDGSISQNWCLDDGCYTFTLNDASGDGVDGKTRWGCGQNGYFEILDSTSTVVDTLHRDDFGSSTEVEFCVSLPTLDDYDIQDLIQVFPIPSSGFITIVLTHPIPNESYQLEVINVLGQSIRQSSLSTQRLSYDMSALRPGVYYLRFTADSWQAEKKIILK